MAEGFAGWRLGFFLEWIYLSNDKSVWLDIGTADAQSTELDFEGKFDFGQNLRTNIIGSETCRIAGFILVSDSYI